MAFVNQAWLGVYVTCIYCSLSMKINMHEMPHGGQRLWMHFACVCGGKKPKYPKLELHGWRRYYTGRYRRSWISGLNLWSIPVWVFHVTFHAAILWVQSTPPFLISAQEHQDPRHSLVLVICIAKKKKKKTHGSLTSQVKSIITKSRALRNWYRCEWTKHVSIRSIMKMIELP